MNKVLFLLVATLILLVSCTASVPTDLGYVCFEQEASKGLSVSTNGRVTSIQYKATPLFTVVYPSRIYGKTDGFYMVGFDGMASEIVGPFTQGKWLFELEARNNAGDILFLDEEEMFISAAKSNVVRFTARRPSDLGNGAIAVNITVPRIREQTDDWLKLVYTDGATTQTKTNFTATRSESSITYTGTITDIPIGWYTLSFSTGYGSTVIGGESITAIVIQNDTAQVTGEILPSSYAQETISIDHSKPISGHIACSTAVIQKGASATLTYVADTGGASASEVSWYVNGTYKTTGLSYTFTPAASGLYAITAVVSRTRVITLPNYINTSTTTTNTIRETCSASYSLRVEERFTSITVAQSAVIVEPPAGKTLSYFKKNGTRVTFPYTTNVYRVHPDGRYTPLELGLEPVWI